MRFREQLEEIFDVMKDKPIKDIVKAIVKDHPEIKLKPSTLQGYLYTLKGEADEVLEVVDESDWTIIDENYVFNAGGVRKIFSIELIDNIFLYYSTRGYNYTRIKVQQRFGIKPRTFHQIQSKFNLSKDSDIISPYTKKVNDPETVKDLIGSKIDTVLDSGEVTALKYQEKLNRRNRKNIETLKLDEGWRNSIVSDMLAEHPLVSEIKVLRDKKNDIDEITVVIADIHAGGKSTKTALSEEWSTEMLIEKLNRVAEITNSYKAKNVHLMILGDLVETVSGLNHPDAWKGIEQGMFGSNVIIQTQEILVKELINKVVNLKTIIATGGNHDRLQSSNKLADTGATDLIFYMIKERLNLMKSNVEVIYDPILVSFATKSFGMIGVHGDKGLHKRELSFVSNKFAVDKNQFQFVFSAHLHSFFCQRNDDQEFARRVTIPAIVTGNDYSDITIGRASKSGMIVVKPNMFGEPDMNVHNL